MEFRNIITFLKVAELKIFQKRQRSLDTLSLQSLSR